MLDGGSFLLLYLEPRTTRKSLYSVVLPRMEKAIASGTKCVSPDLKPDCGV